MSKSTEKPHEDRASRLGTSHGTSIRRNGAMEGARISIREPKSRSRADSGSQFRGSSRSPRDRAARCAFSADCRTRPTPSVCLHAPCVGSYRVTRHRLRQRVSSPIRPAPRKAIVDSARNANARLVARRRLGAKSAESVALSTPGMLEATEALELIQLDHTLHDVMIVDSDYRRSIGRPWLSLAVDVATRSVLGFDLGLEAPSALTVALCIEHAVLPKVRSAASSMAETSWDMFGMPRTILVDNGPEFHGEALTRGCAEYGIELTHRPVARPRFGAHIERLIGTMMGRVHLLPGSTDSSPTARGSYQSEHEAKLTLAKLSEWLYLEIAGQYHHTIHRMIGTTPAAVWVKSLARGTVPTLPADHPRRTAICSRRASTRGQGFHQRTAIVRDARASKCHRHRRHESHEGGSATKGAAAAAARNDRELGRPD